MHFSNHEESVRSRLITLGGNARVAFAATCAERLFAAVGLWRNQTHAGKVRLALDTAWSRAADLPSKVEVARLVSELERMLGNEDREGYSEKEAREQDAIVSAVHALQQLGESEVDHAIWAARQVTDALDRQLQLLLGAGPFDTTREQRIARDRGLLDEKARQLRDLESIANDDTSGLLFDSLRSRAVAEGSSLLTQADS